MIINKRQKEILLKLIASDTLDIKMLMKEMNLPRATIYSDLKIIKTLSVELNSGKIYFSKKHEELQNHFNSKLWLNRDTKERMASHIAQNIIYDGDPIFLDCGSSISILAEKIIENNISGLIVFTNNPISFRSLYYYPGINKIILIGGHVDPNDASIYGEYTSRFLSEILDIEYRKLFLGADSISIDGNIHIENIYEIDQKRIMIEKAKEVYVLLDESKIEKSKGRVIGNIDKLIAQKGNEGIYCIVGLLRNNRQRSVTKEFVKKFKRNVILV
jgi:DeoR family fructose operon transcriptional repressor